MPPRTRRITALFAIVAWTWLAGSALAQQRDLDNLGPPWPQPSPGRPFLELEATVGVGNWKPFFSRLREIAATKGFFAYPYSTDPEDKDSVGMMLCRDDLFVNMYNKEEAPGVFVVGFFHTNIHDELRKAAQVFLPVLGAAMEPIAGASIGNHRMDATLPKLEVRPPMRIAEFSVPPEAVQEAFTMLRHLARRGLFFNTRTFMDRPKGLRRVDMWRTDLKVTAVNQLRPEKFRVTVFSYLPLPNFPQTELDEFADLFIKELAEGVAKIPGSAFTMVNR